MDCGPRPLLCDCNRGTDDVRPQYGEVQEKARALLREHESHLALQRLRRIQPLTLADFGEFEKMLVEAGGTQPILTQVRNLSLGLFVRSLVGLDREAAMEAFSGLPQESTLTPEQIEFVELVIEEPTQNGQIPVSAGVKLTH